MQWKTSSILIWFVVFVASCSFAFAACPSADLNGDCLVNFLDFQMMTQHRRTINLHTIASQWLESDEEEPDPLTILGRFDVEADGSDSFEVEFVVVDKQRLERSVFQYECKVILKNISTAIIKSVQLDMASWPDNMTIIDPNVSFRAEIAPGESAISIDTCAFTVDRSEPIDPVEIIWHHVTTLGDMVLIPGGMFEMGDHFNEGHEDELPVHTVTVDSFYMGKYEITNGQYRDYLNSAISSGQIKVDDWKIYSSSDIANRYPYHCLHSWIEYSDGVFTVRTPDVSNQPAGAIAWYGAAAYCNWRTQQEGYEDCYNLSTWECDFSKNGYRLPTEAEWEYAARGGLSGRRFPWGDTISHAQASYYSWPPETGNRPGYDVSPTWGDHPVHGPIAPVGSFAPNGYGLYDVTGNAWEWCNDWYDSDYYDVSPAVNPTGPVGGMWRVFRGGSWGAYSNSAQACRVANRGYSPAKDCIGGLGYFDLGFRVVRAFQECQAPAFEDVDDMEIYTPWTTPGNNIFEMWRDSVGDCTVGNGNDTGSTVTEYEDPAFVLAGVQSMRFEYDNDGIVFNPCLMEYDTRPYLYSKAEAQIAQLASGIGSNWNACGTTQLVLNFYGQSDNEVEEVDPLWVELKDTEGKTAKVVYGDHPRENPHHLTEESWHEWRIDMAEFDRQGVDTTRLLSIAIGVGSEDATTPGGSGKLYFDEIHLSTPR